jgi:hypothetical protein
MEYCDVNLCGTNGSLIKFDLSKNSQDISKGFHYFGEGVHYFGNKFGDENCTVSSLVV